MSALLISVILAAAGALCGPTLTRFAARRSVLQPLSMELAAERFFLIGVLADLRRLPYVVSIGAGDFAAGAHQRIWTALLAAVPECADLPDDRSEEDCETLGRTIDSRREYVLAAVWRAVRQGPAPDGDGARYRELLAGGRDDIDDVAVVEAGHKVLYAGQDRNRTAGFGLVMPTSTPDSTDPAAPPLRRVYTRPSRLRLWVASGATALAAGLVPWFVRDAGFAGIPAVAAAGALLALVAMSVVISLVDLETFYVDVRTFLVTSSAAWALTVIANWGNGTLGRIVGGLLFVAATAALFEIANRVYRLVRGVDGQGLGDTLIVLATVAIPPALAGDWKLGYFSVMAGMVTAVAGWLIGWARGKLTRATPYAFGPYLAAGWVIGWLASMALGQ